ncbi:MAG TPA: methylmalonyl Co-A mutase-associated GTPase MeaB [Ruminococcaceae bacterium]|nr:methylmalonyl Co-A mutase-associated GTPase MeaB [Oscillospiraceae bacterium]
MKELSKRIIEGDVRSASHLIRNIEDQMPGTDDVMRELFTVKKDTHVIGFTGSPGAGKSTLTDGLITAYRKLDKTIGVLAVDPSSPFSGGAILGDRIRMVQHATDRKVFMRSLSARGSAGGLSKAAGEAVQIMEAMGKDRILVETCGVGQQEVDIIDHAHTVVVVLVPGMGDEVQTIKAGIMEIADIFVINKANRDGAQKLYREISAMLASSPSNKEAPERRWKVPIVMVENLNDHDKFQQSVETLREKLDEHYEYLIKNHLLANKAQHKIEAELKEALWSRIFQPVVDKLYADGEMEQMIDRLVKKETDPYTLADKIAKEYLDK